MRDKFQVGLPQPELNVSETSSSLDPGATGTFQVNISRPIEKTVMVLYSVTDAKTGAITMREALVNVSNSFLQAPFRCASLFTSGTVPLIGASALTVMSDIPSGNPLNSTDFDAALTRTAGDAYKIAIEGYAVEYQNQKGWYFDSQSGSSTHISDESLMFGTKETASFDIPLNVGSGQTNSGIVLAAGETANVIAGGTVVEPTVEGLLNVAAGGIADPTTIGSGGTEVVHRGGTGLGALVSGGNRMFSASPVAPRCLAVCRLLDLVECERHESKWHVSCWAAPARAVSRLHLEERSKSHPVTC